MNGLPPVIGLTGQIGSGKSTVSFLLGSRNYQRVGFADKAKAMLTALGLRWHEINGPARAEPHPMLGGQTPRNALRLLMTEWGRETVCEDLWVSDWQERAGGYIEAARRLGRPVAIVADDLRYQNEADAVRDLGGIIIHVQRPGLVVGDHLSDRQHVRPDHVLHNDGTVASIAAALDTLLSRLEAAA